MPENKNFSRHCYEKVSSYVLYGFQMKKIISKITKYYQNLKVISEKNIIFAEQKCSKMANDNKNLNRIKVILAEKNLQNKWLAEQLGRDQATISKWVTNSAQPPLEALIKIAQCLDVDIKDLIRIPDHNPFKDLD